MTCKYAYQFCGLPSRPCFHPLISSYRSPTDRRANRERERKKWGEGRERSVHGTCPFIWWLVLAYERCSDNNKPTNAECGFVQVMILTVYLPIFDEYSLSGRSILKVLVKLIMSKLGTTNEKQVFSTIKLSEISLKL